jgi:hypothetical protein
MPRELKTSLGLLKMSFFELMDMFKRLHKKIIFIKKSDFNR